MAVTVKEIYRFLDEKAPFSWQEDYDNAGFLVGRQDAEVKRILVALDITEETIQEAAEANAELIVSHHPVIWGSIQSVTDESSTGRKLLLLIEHGLAAICAHTNLDAAEGGVNSELARLLGVNHPVPLQTAGTDVQGRPYGIGRVGEIEEAMSMAAFVSRTKKALKLDGIRVMDAGRPVHKVAVGGGACGDLLSDAIAMGCDTFLTADLKHHLYLEARQAGINLLDAGHFSTEAVVCPVLVQWLRERFPALTVEASSRQKEPFQSL